jgi:hypothetical protein
MASEFNYFPFESGDGAFITEPRWKLMFTWMRTVGVLTTEETLPPDDELFVGPTTPGLSVEVFPGEAFIQGMFWSHTDDPAALAITENDSGDPRIDLVVLRTDFVNDIIEYVVIEGTPDPSPVAPDPVQNDTVWDLPLATVDVADGATEITSMDITDERVPSYQAQKGSSPLVAGSGITITYVGDQVVISSP